MTQFVFGAVSAFVITVMLDLVDSSSPNSLQYYIDLYAPF
jgi:hypothetical protein